MKTTIKILTLLTLASCTKSYVCTIETTSSLGTTIHDVDFKGTKDEMQEYEESGTKTYSGGIDQVTECK